MVGTVQNNGGRKERIKLVVLLCQQPHICISDPVAILKVLSGTSPAWVGHWVVTDELSRVVRWDDQGAIALQAVQNFV